MAEEQLSQEVTAAGQVLLRAVSSRAVQAVVTSSLRLLGVLVAALRRIVDLSARGALPS